MNNETRENQHIENERSPRGSHEGAREAGSGVEGEGSYQAARDYDRGVGEFVRSGRMEQAARDAEKALDCDPDGHREAEQQGKARAQLEFEGALAADREQGADDGPGVHVKHERQGWVVEAGSDKKPAIFGSMDDALRLAHELAAAQHVPLYLHGPDGELIDTFEL